MEFLWGIAALGFVGLLVVGSVVGIVSLVRTRDLEKQVRKLTARIASLEVGPGPTPAPPEPAARPEEIEPTAPAPAMVDAAGSGPRTDRRRFAREDLETLIAGRWLNRIGIVAVMLAASFFLKYAFDNDWVGPAGRVVIGLLAGVGLMVLSQWLLGRGYRYFSEGIAALGGGVLFLSLYAAWSFYELIPMSAAFVGMVVVTATLAVVAMGRSSERLGVLALAAGLVTPALLMPENDRADVLFTYLALLSAGFLVAAWRQTWRWIAPLALAATTLHFAGWYAERYSVDLLVPTCLYAGTYFLLFGTYLLARCRGSALHSPELLLIPANGLLYGWALVELLYSDHRWWLTVAVLLVAALHLGAARMVPAGEAKVLRAARFLFAGVALTFATSAIPIRLEGDWVVIALALEGALLVRAGLRADVGALRSAGAALLLFDVLLLIDGWQATDRFLLNRRFAAFAVLVAALAASWRWADARRRDLDPAERNLFALVAAVGFVVAVWGLSEELWSLLGRQTWGLDPALARQMGLSLLWAVAAGLLILTGVRKRLPGRRRLGLALLGIAILKVFILDLSFLDRAYRIASFLVLGIVLLLVSFWYQKSLASPSRTDDDPEESVEPA